ncbi:MAG TPA: MBL fold metallo-hydrolase [Candidatus Aenigmarchaeota archaeon]|nr:MBL fold metallo-hydrolase [Candidatus Aenigmarchaeota archaeon]
MGNGKIALKFFGSGGEVGRNAILLRINAKNILLDSGVKKIGNREYLPENLDSIATKIDYIILSHAHLDHTGFLPFLYNNGCRAPIYLTRETAELTRLILEDSYMIRKKTNQKAPKPWKIYPYFRRISYYKLYELGNNLYFKAYPAGHIQGSACFVIGDGNDFIFYSGDYNTRDLRTQKKAVFPAENISLAITESTYGGKQDRLPSVSQRDKMFIRIIKETLDSGGDVLIPVFAVGRSQEIFSTLYAYYIAGEIDLNEYNVYFEGTMMEKATSIYNIYNNFSLSFLYDKEIGAFNRVDYRTRDKIMRNKQPKIIIATSGMISGGSSPEYLKYIASDSKNTLLFVGYQAEETVGRDILLGINPVRLDDVYVNIKCRVSSVSFSSHTYYPLTINFLRKIKPERVIVNHGTPEKAEQLAHGIEQLLDVDTILPKNQETVFVDI